MILLLNDLTTSFEFNARTCLSSVVPQGRMKEDMEETCFLKLMENVKFGLDPEFSALFTMISGPIPVGSPIVIPMMGSVINKPFYSLSK